MWSNNEFDVASPGLSARLDRYWSTFVCRAGNFLSFRTSSSNIFCGRKFYRVSQKIVPNFEAQSWSSALLSDKNVSFS